MKEEIEVLDIDDDIIVKKTTINKKDVSKNQEPLKDKKTKIKMKKTVKRKIQILFCSFSAIFILGCIIFYGLRFIKYYRIYNPKIDSNTSGVFLANYITGTSEYATDDEPGLFSSSGNYIYKGNVSNNYLKYNNMLWRIVRINNDKSIDIILDDYINILSWNKDVKKFKESDIFSYLNNDFLNNLDKDLLTTTTFCTDEINDLTKITCNSQENNYYVKLLDIANFLNSVKNGKSYLVDSDEIFWFSDIDGDKVWHSNGVNVSSSTSDVFYEIRPMVRIKETNVYTTGDGSKNNPYVVGNNEKLSLGSEIILGEDKWIVYDIAEDVKLMRSELIDKQLDFDKEKLTYQDSSLWNYLNTTYLDSLSYKDLIVESTWYIGDYKDSLDDIKGTKVNTKVGIPNILDIKFDSNVKSYFTSTINDEYVWVYENPLKPSRITTYRGIRPCISISKDTVNKLKYVDGVFKIGE